MIKEWSFRATHLVKKSGSIANIQDNVKPNIWNQNFRAFLNAAPDWEASVQAGVSNKVENLQYVLHITARIRHHKKMVDKRDLTSV